MNDRPSASHSSDDAPGPNAPGVDDEAPGEAAACELAQICPKTPQSCELRDTCPFREAEGLADRVERLSAVSRELGVRSRDIALQSDRWFLALIDGVDKSLERARAGVAATGHAAWSRSRGWLPRLARSTSPKDRILRAIHQEARRQGLDPTQPGVESFSERIALVVEMVLTGMIDVDDVAFEAEDQPGTPAVSETTPEDGQP